MSLISRQAAIAEFSCCELTPDGGIDANYAIDFLEQMPSAPQWIPCSERLPKEDGSYLVSGKWGSGKESVGDCEFSVEDGYFQTAWNFDVIAWMPLPEPYRKTEPQTENPCDGCVCDDGKHLMYCMNCKGIAWKTEPPKDEPQEREGE